MHLPFWTPCKSLLRGSVEHGVQALTGETIGAQHLNNQKLQQKFKELKANGLPFTCQSLNFLRGLDDGAYPECLEPKKLRLRFSKASLHRFQTGYWKPFHFSGTTAAYVSHSILMQPEYPRSVVAKDQQ